MTHPHFVPPGETPASVGVPAQAAAPGYPAFVAAAEVDHHSDPFGVASDPRGVAITEDPRGVAITEDPLGVAMTEDTSEVPVVVLATVASSDEPDTEPPAETSSVDATTPDETAVDHTALGETTPDAVEPEPEAETTGEAQSDEEPTTVIEVIEDLYADEDDDVFEETAQFSPGDIEETNIAVWDPEIAERYRDAWRDIQSHFVDEPEAALGEAQDLVAEAVQALADALLAEQVSLDPHEEDANPDTEAMRIAMRGYKDFLERVLAL